jgi:hypothetical protein
VVWLGAVVVAGRGAYCGGFNKSICSGTIRSRGNCRKRSIHSGSNRSVSCGRKRVVTGAFVVVKKKQW